MPRRKNSISRGQSDPSAKDSSYESGGLKLVLRVPKLSKPESSEGTVIGIKRKWSSPSPSDDSDNEPLSEKIDSVAVSENDDKSSDNKAGEMAEIGTAEVSATKRKRKKRRFRLTDSIAKAKRRAERKAFLEKEAAEGRIPEVKEEGKEEKTDEGEREMMMPVPSRHRLNAYSPIQLLCDKLLRQFTRKDPQQHFVFPVTSSLAPDYSTVVKTPMDFYTMRHKLDQNYYATVSDFKKDIELIIDNAIKYNEPTTIYYYAAQELKTVESKLLSEENLKYLCMHVPSCNQLTAEQLGFNPFTPLRPADQSNSNDSINNKNTNTCVVVDTIDSDTILEQLRTTTNILTDKLSKRRPTTKLSFLSSNEDGGTCLNIIPNAASKGIDETKEQKCCIRLGDMIGRLKEGTPGLSPFIDYRANIAIPVSYLDYGPYASFAPQYDSTWATISKADSDLLLSTYGDRDNASMAVSMRQLVENTDDRMLQVVDNLLDTLTDDEHSRTMKTLKGNAEVGAVKGNDEENEKDFKKPINFGSLESLKNLGIDVSFLKSTQWKYEKDCDRVSESIGEKLDDTAILLKDLQTVQYKRLSEQPQFTLTDIEAPKEQETELASAVVDQLKNLTAMAPPGSCISPPQIHKAMGIGSAADVDFDVLREFFSNSD